jgi:N-acetylmuramoyl-L-alanine amidase
MRAGFFHLIIVVLLLALSSQAHAASSVFSISDIQNHYTNPAQKVRILVVPGHQPFVGGTQFGGLWEREVVADIADTLAALLRQNPKFDVLVAREKYRWNPIFESYFRNTKSIERFIKKHKKEMKRSIRRGTIQPNAAQVHHNTASTQGALQLYGFTKWANDRRYDIVLHLHLNDAAGRDPDVPGAYSGFSIYVPDHQFKNASSSRAIAESIAARLNDSHATSTFPGEAVGIVEDQQLIATGAYNSAKSAALLIEYAYIYEPQFHNDATRDAAIAEYAHLTYQGLQDFFKESER